MNRQTRNRWSAGIDAQTSWQSVASLEPPTPCARQHIKNQFAFGAGKRTHSRNRRRLLLGCCRPANIRAKRILFFFALVWHSTLSSWRVSLFSRFISDSLNIFFLSLRRRRSKSRKRQRRKASSCATDDLWLAIRISNPKPSSIVPNRLTHGGKSVRTPRHAARPNDFEKNICFSSFVVFFFLFLVCFSRVVVVLLP